MNYLNKIRSQLTSADGVKLALILCTLFIFGIFLAGPLMILFFKAFQDKSGAFVALSNFSKYLTSPNMFSSFWHTMDISLVSMVCSVTLAFITAYALTRRKIPFKGVFQFIARLPMFAPTMLLGMSLIYLFGNKGLLTGLGFAIPLYGRAGIIISETIYCFPVALMILMVAFSSADNRLYEAAEVLGTKPMRKLFTITIPSVRYGLINALFVCFTYSFTDFGAPSVVGGNYNVLATDVYKQVIGQQNFNMGAVLGIIMLLPTVVSFIVDRITSKKQASAISSRSIPYQIRPNKKADFLATAFCVVISLMLIGFFGISLYGSLIKFWPYNLTLTLSNYNFSDIGCANGFNAILQSIKVSILVAIFGTIIAFFDAYLVEKVRPFQKLRKVLYFFSISPNAIPGTVIGLAYILFFNPQWLTIPGTTFEIENVFSFLYNTTAILVCVNIIHYFAVPFITASTSLKRLDKEFELVSDSLNVSFIKTLFRITVPLSLRAILEMAVYFFMNSMVTVSAIVFLCTSSTLMASVVVMSVQGAGRDAQAAAICMILMGINILVRLLYEALEHFMSKKTEAWICR